MADTYLEFTWEKAKEIAIDRIEAHTKKCLTTDEIQILKGSWNNKKYREIALELNLSSDYVQKDLGYHLWRKLEDSLKEYDQNLLLKNEKVNKINFQEILRRAWEKSRSDINSYPEGWVKIGSPLYVNRDTIESRCYHTILKPGSLLRIKAPMLMGKTSLIMRILYHAKKQNYQTVYLDFNNPEGRILADLERFIRWFCNEISDKLELEDRLDDYWSSKRAISTNCNRYFERYLLAEIDYPLVLALDTVDRIFSHTEVSQDFFGLLRGWHEDGKISDILKKLRIVMAYSTEVYIPLDINQSPFNVGDPIELTEFDYELVDDLASRHELDWNNIQINQLIEMVGGHPYLVRLAMYEVSRGNITLERLLEESPTEAGIYSVHLRKNLHELQKSSDLVESYKKVVNSSKPVELDPIHTCQLFRMGLVQIDKNQVIPRCGLYRDYFRRVL